MTALSGRTDLVRHRREKIALGLARVHGGALRGRELGGARDDPCLQRLVQLLQRRLGGLAGGRVLEQHGDLAPARRLDAERGQLEIAAGRDQLALEADRLARQKDVAIALDPAVSLVGDHLPGGAPDAIRKARMLLESRIGLDMDVVAERPVRPVEERDDAKADIDRVEQGPVSHLAVAQLRLRELAVVHVLDDAIPADDLALGIAARLRARPHPAVRAGPCDEDAIIDIDRRARRKARREMRDRMLEIVRVQRLDPPCPVGLARLLPGQLQPALRVGRDAALRIAGPGHLWIELDRVAIMVLALQQARLRQRLRRDGFSHVELRHHHAGERPEDGELLRGQLARQAIENGERADRQPIRCLQRHAGIEAEAGGRLREAGLGEVRQNERVLDTERGDAGRGHRRQLGYAIADLRLEPLPPRIDEADIGESASRTPGPPSPRCRRTPARAACRGCRSSPTRRGDAPPALARLPAETAR